MRASEKKFLVSDEEWLLDFQNLQFAFNVKASIISSALVHLRPGVYEHAENLGNAFCIVT